MSILKAVKQIANHIIFRVTDKMLHVYYRHKKDEYTTHLTLGEGSHIHVPPLCPQIENLQKDPQKLVIGKNTHIRGTIFIYPYGNGVQIGDNSYLGENSIVRAGNSIIIGNNVLIAHNVTILDTDSHELDSVKRAESYAIMIREGHPDDVGLVKTSPVRIEDDVWISYGSSILKGVTIAKGAIIGAGSVVTHDIPSYCLAAGNPAKVIKKLK